MSDIEKVLDNIDHLYKTISGFGNDMHKNKMLLIYWLEIDGKLYSGGINFDNIERLTDADKILRAERKYREMNHLPHRDSQDKYKEFARI